jgi:hypothetical protein
MNASRARWLAGAATVIAMAACGGQPRTAGSPASTPASARSPAPAPAGGSPTSWQSYDPRWSNAAYADCLRQRGIQVTGPDSYGDLGFGSKPLNRAAFQAAQSACEQLWPPARSISVDAILRSQRYRQRFQACLGADSSPDRSQSCRAKLGPLPDLTLPRPSRS